MRKYILPIVLFPLVLLLGNCDATDGRSEVVGSFEAKTTGAIQNTVRGEADSPVAGNLLQVRLRADNDRSVDIIFAEHRSAGEEGFERREGSYLIRLPNVSRDDSLAAEVTYRLCDSVSEEATCTTETFVGTDGVLDIDSIDEEGVRGTFSFRAVPLKEVGRDDPSRQLKVDGRFMAPFVVVEG